jgi:hypothetical protein
MITSNYASKERHWFSTRKRELKIFYPSHLNPQTKSLKQSPPPGSRIRCRNRIAAEPKPPKNAGQRQRQNASTKPNQTAPLHTGSTKTTHPTSPKPEFASPPTHSHIQDDRGGNPQAARPRGRIGKAEERRSPRANGHALQRGTRSGSRARRRRRLEQKGMRGRTRDATRFSSLLPPRGLAVFSWAETEAKQRRFCHPILFMGNVS